MKESYPPFRSSSLDQTEVKKIRISALDRSASPSAKTGVYSTLINRLTHQPEHNILRSEASNHLDNIPQPQFQQPRVIFFVKNSEQVSYVAADKSN